MRKLTLGLDALPSLREATRSAIDVAAAATLSELAGVDAVRLGITEDLKPVREQDVLEARRATRGLELRMPPVPGLVKVALAARPNRVLLASPGRDGRSPSWPLDLRGRRGALEPVIRVLSEAGIPVGALVQPDIDSVKTAHGQGVGRVELFTGVLVDLPMSERHSALEGLGDAVRLAAKLRIGVSLGGGLSYRALPEILEAAPAVEGVAVGRGAIARAMLVGLDRALRDLRGVVA